MDEKSCQCHPVQGLLGHEFFVYSEMSAWGFHLGNCTNFVFSSVKYDVGEINHSLPTQFTDQLSLYQESIWTGVLKSNIDFMNRFQSADFSYFTQGEADNALVTPKTG